MWYIDTQDAVATLPAPQPAGTPGYFSGGNPATGEKPTTVSPDFMNMVEVELGTVVSAANIQFSKSNNGQLYEALQYLISQGVQNAMPSGSVIMWSGTVTNIPSGWAICDGSNGTPNLTDKFIVAQGSTFAANTTGGNTGNSLTLTEAQLPPITPTVNNPPHTHAATASAISVNAPAGINYYNGSAGNNPASNVATTAQGTGTITLSGPAPTITVDAATTDVTVATFGGGQAIDITPEYFAMIFIMKL